MYRNQRIVATALLASGIFLAGFSTYAGTDELEALMKKSYEEAKTAGADFDKDAIGHYYSVQGEYVLTDAQGKSQNHPISWTPYDSWGCNESPNQVQVTEKFEHTDTLDADKSTGQHIAHAKGVYYFDRKPSTEIAGSVVDKSSKPLQGVEVRAENIDRDMPAVTATTDASGRYALKVRSGHYRVTAKDKECTALQTLLACAWGKIHDPRIHVPLFPLDLVMGCTPDMTLNITGKTETKSDVKVEGIAFSGGTQGNEAKGEVPLTLDAQTGQISGSGTLHFQPMKSQVGGSAFGVGMNVDASFSAYEWPLNAHGQLDSSNGQASLTVECAGVGARATSAVITTDVTSTSGSDAGETEGCSGADWNIRFTLPWKEGETHHEDRKDSHSQEGVSYVYHEVFDLTLGQKTEPGKPSESGEHKQPEPSGQSLPTPGGKRSSGSNSFNLPAEKDVRENPEDERPPVALILTGKHSPFYSLPKKIRIY